MTSIDDLFKKPGLPGSNNKRKFAPVQNPSEAYKSAKLSANGDAKGKLHVSKQATIQEEEEEEAEIDDAEAGPEIPPNHDEVEEIQSQDDEGGRFFGGGVSRDTADVLDFIESREEDDQETSTQEKFDSAWVKRLALNFERRISKNAELRAKFETEPQKFMTSEADLDADIKSLSVLTEHPDLYSEFADLGCLSSLVSLIGHENTDIAIDAIEILAELTDEDVQAEQDQWDILTKALLEADLPSLMVDNLGRLDESNEVDRGGVYHTLSLFENLFSDSDHVDAILESSSLLEWLMSRIQKKNSPVDQNTQYAAELLCIIAQSSPKSRSKLIGMNATDSILQLLAMYRKSDPPKNTEEEEYAENLFDALVCLVDEDQPSSSLLSTSAGENSGSRGQSLGKSKFLEAEGLELLLIMLREPELKFSKPRALRVLDAALSGDPFSGAGQLCERLVIELAGLKTIFSLFMKQKHKGDSWTSSCLGVFVSLLKSLPGDSAARIRTLAKFVEKDYEKVARLIILRVLFQKRLEPVEKEIEIKQIQMTDEERRNDLESLTSRLDAGLINLQNIDVILAWLVAEDDGARQKILSLLAEHGQTLKDVKRTLAEQLEIMGSKHTAYAGADETEGNPAAEMLRTLIQLLD